jgi:hypothetical protein
MYSTVNSRVKPISVANSASCHRASIEAMLSSTTTATLARMHAISVTSKARPAGVSASKMTVCSRCRQGEVSYAIGDSVAGNSRDDGPPALLSRPCAACS